MRMRPGHVRVCARRYGGDAEGRFTIVREILGRVAATSFPLSRVGVKISPNSGFNGMGSADNVVTFMHVASGLSALGVAYLHVVDNVQLANAATWFGACNSNGFHGSCPALTLADVSTVFPGALIGNGGYERESAAKAVGHGHATAISFGRMYMSNPDLVERFLSDLPLAELPPKELWFEPSAERRADRRAGYTEFGPYAPPAAAAAPGKKRVLHLLGSPTSAYYEGLSLMYAQVSGAAQRSAAAEAAPPLAPRAAPLAPPRRRRR